MESKDKKPMNYGLIIEDTDNEAYVLGGLGSLPKEILQPDGDWSAYLPDAEKQYEADFDTYNCSSFGSLNGLEIMMKRLYNK